MKSGTRKQLFRACLGHQKQLFLASFWDPFWAAFLQTQRCGQNREAGKAFRPAVASAANGVPNGVRNRVGSMDPRVGSMDPRVRSMDPGVRSMDPWVPMGTQGYPSMTGWYLEKAVKSALRLAGPAMPAKGTHGYQWILQPGPP